MAFEEGASMRGDSLNQSRKSSSSSLSQGKPNSTKISFGLFCNIKQTFIVVELPRIESFKIEYIDDQKIWENKIVEF